MIHLSKRSFTLGLLAAAASGLAVAQAAPADGGAAAAEGGRNKAGSHWAEHRARHLQAFKEELKLDAGQEDAWTRYTEAMAQPRARRGQGEREDFRKLSTPERLDHVLERQAQRQEHFRERSDAIKAFYAQLNPEQQKIFDERAMRGRGHGKHRRHGHWG